MNNKIIIPSRVNNNGVTIQTNSDGSFNINGTALDLIYVSIKRYSVQNHLYLGCLENGIVEDNKFILYNDTDNGLIFGPQPSILKSKKDSLFYILIKPGMSFDNLKCHAYCYDLTQMFGSGNEPTTPDDFAKRLGYSSIDDVPFVPYNEGEIVSSFAEGIKTSSRNLMKGLSDMEMFNSYFGFSLPTNSDYHLSLKKRNPLANTPKGSIGFIWDYDRQAKALWAVDDGVEKNLSFALRTSYYNNGKIIFGVYPQTLAQEFLATYEIQIEFGTEPTDYVQPQSWVRKWKNTIDKYFPDGLKSAGSVYDEITPTKAVKRIETIDLGELNWGYNNESSSKKAFFSIERFDSKTNGNFDYIVSNDSLFKKPFTPIFWDKSLIIETEVDYNSISELKKALSGVKLCFEYAPEEYAYDELNLTEQVAEGGTEEAIITDGKTSTPLRADIVYPIDAYNTIKANKTNIGTLSSLNTANKTDLVSAINELAVKVGALEAKATEVTKETTE